MGWRVTVLRFKYVNEYVDRTGKLRRYFRKNGKQRPLPGEVGSAEFMAAYAAYLAEQPIATGRPVVHADSLAKLIIDFYGSRFFTDRKPSTRKLYRYALDPVAREHGYRSVSLMTAENVEKIINKIGEKRPGMGNLTRAVLRRVMHYAVKAKWRSDNPAIGVDAFKVGEHHSWTDVELRQFENKWRPGTRERLAYALLLYTGQRVGDVARMSLADIVDGLIYVEQEKTGAKLYVPIAPELELAMKAYPTKGFTLIGDANGRPLKRAALSYLMRKSIKEAGLPPRCVPHGLRKAAMRRLAEADATDKQIAAVSGHKTLREIERYTKAADQKKLARAGMNKLRTRVPNGSDGSA
jgi:enterobacteria phage integrase